jgi:hypothetical protein
MIHSLNSPLAIEFSSFDSVHLRNPTKWLATMKMNLRCQILDLIDAILMSAPRTDPLLSGGSDPDSRFPAFPSIFRRAPFLQAHFRHFFRSPSIQKVVFGDFENMRTVVLVCACLAAFAAAVAYAGETPANLLGRVEPGNRKNGNPTKEELEFIQLLNGGRSIDGNDFIVYFLSSFISCRSVPLENSTMF